jgi:hypothetical protein
MTLRHVVAWKLNETDPDERASVARTIHEKLTGLKSVIDDIITIEVGINAAGPDGNYDVVLIADYADEAALDRYQTHPAHLEVSGYVKTKVTSRAAVDYFD